MVIDISKVVSVYSGRPGCACGCRGKHTYASAHATKAGRGGQVSDRVVKRIVNTVQKLGPQVDDLPQLVWAETPTRSYIIYFER